MSGETQAAESGWTTDTWAAHTRALRDGDIDARALFIGLVIALAAVAAVVSPHIH